jgi:hypothetical protein
MTPFVLPAGAWDGDDLYPVDQRRLAASPQLAVTLSRSGNSIVLFPRRRR